MGVFLSIVGLITAWYTLIANLKLAIVVEDKSFLSSFSISFEQVNFWLGRSLLLFCLIACPAMFVMYRK